MDKNLLEKTKELARNTREPVTRICRDAQLTTRWYYKLMAGEIPDPGVRRVQRLHDYLAGRDERQGQGAA